MKFHEVQLQARVELYRRDARSESIHRYTNFSPTAGSYSTFTNLYVILNYSVSTANDPYWFLSLKSHGPTCNVSFSLVKLLCIAHDKLVSKGRLMG